MKYVYATYFWLDEILVYLLNLVMNLILPSFNIIMEFKFQIVTHCGWSLDKFITKMYIVKTCYTKVELLLYYVCILILLIFILIIVVS